MNHLPLKVIHYFLLRTIILLTIVINATVLSAGNPTAFSHERAGFSVKFKDEISPYKIIGIFVLPNESLNLEVIDSGKKANYQIVNASGILKELSEKKWQWQAPNEKGLYPVVIYNVDSGDSTSLNIFVMVPFSKLKGEYLNSYRIGKYPIIPLKKLQIYKPPKGFIEATKEIEETLVSPHFKLNQFFCKQECNSPKYLVLKERLLLKLELILEKVNGKGYHCNTFHIMSGYRTPHYNKAIGNVKYSRHCWGDAADIFIDENPKDGMMDDLNNDRKINYKDAAILYDIIDEMYGQLWYEILVGGLGRYKKTTHHGPFVHVDVRGFRARWGD